MKSFIITALLLLGSFEFNFAQAHELSAVAFGGEGVGGGNAECEARIKEIRDDFAKWFLHNGPQKRQLDLSQIPGLTYEELTKAVTPWFKEGAIVPLCINPIEIGQNPGLFSPIAIHASEILLKYNKTCFYETIPEGVDAFGNSIQRVRISCDNRSIRNVTTDEKVLAGAQYVQIGHEILGAAHIENPINPNDLQDSRYPLSQQFRSFLEPVTQQRLSDTPPPQDSRDKTCEQNSIGDVWPFDPNDCRLKPVDFPWFAIDGTWIGKNNGDDILFSIKVEQHEDGREQNIRVHQIDFKNHKLLFSGYVKVTANIARGLMRSTVGPEFYDFTLLQTSEDVLESQKSGSMQLTITMQGLNNNQTTLTKIKKEK
jgi:hypothetical protein